MSSRRDSRCSPVGRPDPGPESVDTGTNVAVVKRCARLAHPLPYLHTSPSMRAETGPATRADPGGNHADLAACTALAVLHRPKLTMTRRGQGLPKTCASYTPQLVLLEDDDGKFVTSIDSNHSPSAMILEKIKFADHNLSLFWEKWYILEDSCQPAPVINIYLCLPIHIAI